MLKVGCVELVLGVLSSVLGGCVEWVCWVSVLSGCVECWVC